MAELAKQKTAFAYRERRLPATASGNLMIYLYNFVLLFAFFLALPLAACRLLMGKDGFSVYRQKLGRYSFPPPKSGGLWIHAVSVGEVNGALALVDEFLRRNPHIPVIFSTGTTTGMALARERLKNRATLAYFPLDFPFAVKSALSFFSPALIVFMETEIWPNFIYHARKRGHKTMLINGRISDRSFSRYRKLRRFFAPFIGSIDRFLMQSETDAVRIKSLGAEEKAVLVAGNLKFDRPLPGVEENRNDIRRFFGIPQGRPVIIFASSHPGEEELFLRVIKKLLAKIENLYTVIAPRHVERAPVIKKLCANSGLDVRLRSEKKAVGGSVLILDTYGELAKLYGAVDMAVIGGSFIPHGGQNPLEAAGWKLPVIFGRHMNNFREISQKLIGSGGAVQANSEEELSTAALNWFEDERAREKAGLCAYNAIIQNRGALQKTVVAVEDLFKNNGR